MLYIAVGDAKKLILKNIATEEESDERELDGFIFGFTFHLLLSSDFRSKNRFDRCFLKFLKWFSMVLLGPGEGYMEWLEFNKEWVFSGIGVFVMGFFLVNKVKEKIVVKNSQKVSAGDCSKIIQINTVKK